MKAAAVMAHLNTLPHISLEGYAKFKIEVSTQCTIS